MASEPATDSDEELWTTARVAAELGVSEKILLDYVTAKGIATARSRGKSVLTEAGLEKIRACFDDLSPSSAQEQAPAGDSLPVAGHNGSRLNVAKPTEDLLITRAGISARSVLAQRDNGLEVVLLVKTTALLKAGMILRDCLQDGDAGTWCYQGRLPRVAGEQQLYFGKIL